MFKQPTVMGYCVDEQAGSQRQQSVRGNEKSEMVPTSFLENSLENIWEDVKKGEERKKENRMYSVS